MKNIIEINSLKKIYKPGLKVKLVKMEDSQAPKPGEFGIIKGVDDGGDVLVEWENGSSLKVILDVDIIELISE